MAPIYVLAANALLLTMTLAGTEAYQQSMKLKTRPSDGATLCAMDPPTSSVKMDPSMPGAPGPVRCGMSCTSADGCRHFNYKPNESKRCQLYNYEPTNFDVSPNCQHYHNPASCPVTSGFTYDSGSNTCFKLLNSHVNWSTATSQCYNLHTGAHLIVINDRLKQTAVRNFLESSETTNCGSYWTAGQRIDPDRETYFIWRVTYLNGTTVQLPVRYTNWQNGQPSFEDGGVSGESCLALIAGWNYSWNDVLCYSDQCPLCEVNP